MRRLLAVSPPQRLVAGRAFLRFQPPLLRRTRRFGRTPRRRPVRAARQLLPKPPKGDAQVLRPRALVLAFHGNTRRSEEHTSELQSRPHLVCRLLLEKNITST